MFDDIDIDNIEVPESDITLSDINVDEHSAVENVSFDDNLSTIDLVNSITSIDFESINSAESFLHHYGGNLSLEEVQESIQEASDFFNMDSPQIVSEGWTTGVFNRDLTTVNDDVLIFNPDQLERMGITEKDGLDLVMTHENTHRALQGLDTHFSDHQEELCCDYMSGVRAGLNDIDTSQMVSSLSETAETISHPAGAIRVDAIQEGYEFGQSFLAEHGHAPTFEDCLEHFIETGAFQQTSDPLAIVPNPTAGSDEFHGFTQADVDYYEHQARISSGSEQAHWLKEAKWARDHIHSFVDDESSLGEPHEFHRGEYGNATGDYIDDSHPTSELGELHGFVDDKAWHEKRAQENLEWANWHRKEAERATDRGDYAAAKDHLATANSYDSKAKDCLNAAKSCTK